MEPTGKKSGTKKAAAKKGVARQRARKPDRVAEIVATEEKLERLVEAIGNNRLAQMLMVNRSQPSRWRTGEEGIGAESARRVVDLEYVMSRLGQLYPEAVADAWLMSFNAHLGARPVDVLRLKGAGPVVAAIDAEAEGAYA
jgi:hypothetical protein